MNLIEKINTLVVRLKLAQGGIGSGFIVLPSPNSDKVYVITAKHCIYYQEGSNAFGRLAPNTEITIDFLGGVQEKAYTLVESDKVLFYEENDIDLAILVLPKTTIESLIGVSVPLVKGLELNLNIPTCTFKGFPKAEGNRQATTLQNLYIFHTDSNQITFPINTQDRLETQNDSTLSLVQGYSGSGVWIEVFDTIFFLGIVAKAREWNNRFICVKIEHINPLLEIANLPALEILNLPNFSILKELNLTSEWFREKLRFSIDNLGQRYTPEFHYDLPNSNHEKYFNAIQKNATTLNELNNWVSEIAVSKSKIDIQRLEKYKEKIIVVDDEKTLQAVFSDISSLIDNINTIIQFFTKEPQTDFQINRLNELCKEISKYKTPVNNTIRKANNKKDNEYLDFLEKFEELFTSINKFQTSINQDFIKLYNNPILLIKGRAGMGKSHLLADFAQKIANQDNKCLFLLGQHFITNDSPSTQIINILQVNNFPTILGFIDVLGQIQGKRFIIFIDAINEGQGLYVWKEYLNTFINEITQYKNIGLVLSVRTEYENNIFGENSSDLVKYTHNGFVGYEQEVAQHFFKKSEISHLNIPIIPEFANPLFLKLFTLAVKNNPSIINLSGYRRISKIFSSFLFHVNTELSKQDKYDYFPERINLVVKAIQSFTKEIIEKQVEYLPYELAFEVIDNSTNKFISKKGFLNGLITEGVLQGFHTRTLDKDFDFIDFKFVIDYAYQRLGEHLKANFLLQNIDKERLALNFQKGGHIYKYVKNEDECAENKGLIEALSIQIREKYNIELFEVAPQLRDFPSMQQSLIDSFSWLDTKTIQSIVLEYNLLDEKTFAHFEKDRFFYQNFMELYLEAFYKSIFYEDSTLNITPLHQYLSNFSLAKRDATWTQWLHYQYGEEPTSVKRLIDWAWSEDDKSYIDDESIFLIAIVISWFLVSNNRKLRDCATKALVRLLENRIHLIMRLLKEFEGVNDLYLSERLFAVAYGSVLRKGEQQKEAVKDLVLYIYQTIFNHNGETLPHILLRDYARNTIEFALQILEIELDIDYSRIHPSSYKSDWVDLPENSKKLKDYSDEYDVFKWSLDFGDFKKYIIGDSYVSNWLGVLKKDFEKFHETYENSLTDSQTKLQNDIKKIDKVIAFAPGDDELDEIDCKDLDEILDEIKSVIFYLGILNKDDEQEIASATVDELEEIDSKKWKLLNSLELLKEWKKNLITELHDSITSEQVKLHEDYEQLFKTNFSAAKATEWIFNKVLELGWNPEMHRHFDKSFNMFDRSGRKSERIGKKYQWIAYHEFLAKLADNFVYNNNDYGFQYESGEYEGTWENWVRDIDPSNLSYRVLTEKWERKSNNWWCPLQKVNPKNWDFPYNDWIILENNVPNPMIFIEFKEVKNEEWLALYSSPFWKPEILNPNDKNVKEIWYQIKSYLVSSEDIEEIKKDYEKLNFSMNDFADFDIHEGIYYRELYDSLAYDAYVKQRERDMSKNKLTPTWISYTWECERDLSKEEISFSMTLPHKKLYEEMNLKFHELEGSFTDSKESVICYDPSITNVSPPCLLIHKQSLLEFLKSNDLHIIWIVNGEKQAHNLSDTPSYNEWRYIRGFYYLDNDTLKGEMQVKKGKRE